jgi:uncharacterized protein YgbK (DUF1537 family)
MTFLLGCIADDFTGATDLANNLVRAGMRTIQTIGVPEYLPDGDVDAIVIALKSRTIPPQEAVEQSLAALRWLQAHHARQIYFKYCSTFDSTDRGNIGPVTDALMDALGADFTIACPAFPENGRTIFRGHLFVGDTLLADSSMRHHPLTPMTDSNLVNVLQRQTHRKVGLIDYRTLAQGADAVKKRISELRADGVQIAVVDAIDNTDLITLGTAVADLPLLTAGSGVAIGLPANFTLQASGTAATLPDTPGLSAIISGSCSAATNEQVRYHRDAGRPSMALDPLRMAAGHDVIGEALKWAHDQPVDAVPLFYSTASPDDVLAIQTKIGVADAGEIVERTLAAIACGLVRHGVRNLIVAGGETSGAVVQALDIQHLRIGPQIDPGVPWCAAKSPASADAPLRVALKSGNFGTADFFLKAWAVR